MELLIVVCSVVLAWLLVGMALGILIGKAIAAHMGGES